ncbi:MAG: hypothetical protein EOL88_07045 [Bacteroidia bacterium]|nr:hypothetical protein [Bacteroidales bacterium]MDD3011318.1 hypothetical protein [Bacteroidales bacterium]MDD3962158.1 hypothetical protein [Bacteroidales bacterium]MDY0286814.1 hypothetical protein [Bacteroidales bacterium]NCD41832.1 hypothetical protein [Bacteroidia bacterium]
MKNQVNPIEELESMVNHFPGVYDSLMSIHNKAIHFLPEMQLDAQLQTDLFFLCEVAKKLKLLEERQRDHAETM